jgi:hypothetical protein
VLDLAVYGCRDEATCDRQVANLLHALAVCANATNAATKTTGAPTAVTVLGNVRITSNVGLRGRHLNQLLASVTHITGSLAVEYNTHLELFDQAPRLLQVAGHVSFVGNEQLKSISLGRLRCVGGNTRIDENQELHSVSMAMQPALQGRLSVTRNRKMVDLLGMGQVQVAGPIAVCSNGASTNTEHQHLAHQDQASPEASTLATGGAPVGASSSAVVPSSLTNGHAETQVCTHCACESDITPDEASASNRATTFNTKRAAAAIGAAVVLMAIAAAIVFVRRMNAAKENVRTVSPHFHQSLFVRAADAQDAQLIDF